LKLRNGTTQRRRVINHPDQHAIFIADVAAKHQGGPDFGRQPDPKSTCHTSPRLGFGMLSFPPVKRACALGGDGHHFIVGQLTGNLRLHPARELNFLPFWQACHCLLNFSNCAHG